MSNPLEAIRNALIEAYKHRHSDGIVCTGCGAINRRFAFHLVEYAQPEKQPLPERFVPQSASAGTIRGVFVFCDSCAPACRKCDLPRVTARVRAAFKTLHKSVDSADTPLKWGVGRCQHTHLFGVWPI